MEHIQKIKEKLSSDIILFGKVCLPSMFSSESPQFHHELADLLIKPEVNKINVIAPRGHAKSSLIACIFPFTCIVGRYLEQKLIRGPRV